MLGVVENPHDDPADQLLRELGEELGVADTYKHTPVGIYFGAPGKTVPDPFFGGDGPERTGCLMCGRCMVGCVHGAKNTLVKNYLWLAERLGAVITPERTVIDIRPIGAADGSEGYEVESERSGAWLRKDRRVQRARGVVVAAGPLGTNRLLQQCRLGGSLPAISSRLGELVRTNSESILTVTVPEDYHDDLVKRVAITSSIYPDPNTHIETVTYGDDGDSMRMLYTLMTGDGTRVTRPLKLLAQILRHPGRLRKVLFAKRWSRRTIIILVMQTLDNAIALRPRKGPFGSFWLQTEQDPERPNPTFIPVANQAGGLVRQTDRRDRAELVHGGDVQHPLHRAHPRRRRDRRRPERGRRRRRPARVRLREPARLRRCGGAGQRRREPLAHDHRARRARDEPDPGEPRRPARLRSSTVRRRPGRTGGLKRAAGAVRRGNAPARRAGSRRAGSGGSGAGSARPAS